MNFASLPQQWMLSRERLRRKLPTAPVLSVPKKKPG